MRGIETLQRLRRQFNNFTRRQSISSPQLAPGCVLPSCPHASHDRACSRFLQTNANTARAPAQTTPFSCRRARARTPVPARVSRTKYISHRSPAVRRAKTRARAARTHALEASARRRTRLRRRTARARRRLPTPSSPCAAREITRINIIDARARFTYLGVHPARRRAVRTSVRAVARRGVIIVRHVGARARVARARGRLRSVHARASNRARERARGQHVARATRSAAAETAQPFARRTPLSGIVSNGDSIVLY